MKARPLLIATALFCSTSARAEPPLEVCTVVTNTKSPMMDEAPCVADEAPLLEPAEEDVEEVEESEEPLED
ncbi:MAG: hypothetical protein KC912_25460, partial [Proteobacteria bacterium]|nr:hypothetical protein [Pseudomonadota bacterium]